jgi:mono/diheme cytochrome c family protein
MLCLIVLACGSALYIPSATHTSDPEALASMQKGRELYISKCSSCHNLYKPQSYTTEKWKHQMIEMKMQAQITDVQADLILSYLTNYPVAKK